MKKYLTAISCAFVVLMLCIGCGRTITPEQRSVLQEKRIARTTKVKQKLQDSAPKIRLIEDRRYEVRTEPKNILIFYKNPKSFNHNMNRHHYVMGSYSKPEKRYVKIARVTVSRGGIDDEGVLEELKKLASDTGGDAVINVYRDPVAGGTHEDSYADFPIFGAGIPEGSIYSMDVAGYKYKGVVIRFKDKDDSIGISSRSDKTRYKGRRKRN